MASLYDDCASCRRFITELEAMPRSLDKLELADVWFTHMKEAHDFPNGWATVWVGR